jgi:hypothetical protein
VAVTSSTSDDPPLWALESFTAPDDPVSASSVFLQLMTKANERIKMALIDFD